MSPDTDSAAAEPTEHEPFRLFRGGPVLLVVTLTLVAVIVAVDPPWSRDEPSWPPMAVRDVSRSILEDERHWSVVDSDSRHAPEVGVLLPAVHWRARGGEKPALIVPPGSAVGFRVEPGDVGDAGWTRLRAHVGIDREAFEHIRDDWREVRFRFEVLVDGVVSFDTELALARGMEVWENEWHPVHPGTPDDAPGEDPNAGLVLGPGDEVVLRTSVRSVPPSQRVQDLRWRVGFADLELEREVRLPREPVTAEAPNIVLVMMDTQRRDRLGCYGAERDLTPNVDALATRGTVFDNAYATSSWTWPSTASVLTGLAPQEHGVLDRSSYWVAQRLELLGETLQRRGYTTAAFSGSPLIVSEKSWDQGFEHFDEGPPRTFRKSPEVVPAAIEWLRARTGERFFVYLHLVDPHDPPEPDPVASERFVTVPRPSDFDDDSFTRHVWALRQGKARTADGTWDTSRVASAEHRRWIAEQYDASVWTGDLWLGRFLAALDELGLTESTVVAYTSDHGEELFDHGMLEHAHSVFGELVRVPLVLAGPGIPAGRRVATPVSNRHLAPTLARIGGAGVDGVDLAHPDTIEPSRVLFGTRQGWWNNWYRTPIAGVRDGDWVLHVAPAAGDWGAAAPPPGGQLRLYDLGSDPGETRDLAPGEPERAAAMRAWVERRTAELAARRSAPSIGGGEATAEMLEAIGYVDGGGR